MNKSFTSKNQTNMLQLITPLPYSEFTSVDFHHPRSKVVKIGNSIINPQPDTHLFALFTAEVLNRILNQPECVGIRMYPGMENNQLVFVILGVDAQNNDMFLESHNQCGCGYPDSSIPSRLISREVCQAMILANESDPERLSILRNLQEIPRSARHYFKAFFSKDFLINKLRTNVNIRFDMAELTFDGNSNPQRTITVSSINEMGESELEASLLPCPPHCGGGDYAPNLTLH